MQLLLDCGDHLGKNIVEVTEAGGGRALPKNRTCTAVAPCWRATWLIDSTAAVTVSMGRRSRGERAHLRLETVRAAGLQRHRDVVAGRAFDEWLDQELGPDVGGALVAMATVC